MEPIPSSSSHSHVHSISDQVLSDKLWFIQEIGCGNWGSVWLCQPMREEEGSHKMAVKLVHRSKTKTTAARVKSLWNEMKVVKALSADGEFHRSIIPFHSFIMTPSYALITMEYLPTLMPVEVEESISKHWFRSLLSAIKFCHTRGVVHNDIKPANILLSRSHVPVLVDFGFAEQYPRDDANAFRSNLSYGTPEYLSPERARGHLHDTRKSDVWSLGISLFEILVGRTPFEHSDGEQFTTKEDLEKYWERTVKGKWIGPYKMSRSLENLLRKMLCPNAETRYTAFDACNDVYWSISSRSSTMSSHKRAASAGVGLRADTLNAISAKITSPWSKARSSRTSSTVDVNSTASIASAPVTRRPLDKSSANGDAPVIRRHVSRPDIRVKIQAKRGLDLSPIKASPPTTPRAAAKENARSPSPLAHRTHLRTQSELKVDTDKDKRRLSVVKNNASPVSSRPSSPLNPLRHQQQTASSGMRHHPVTASAKKNLPPPPPFSPSTNLTSPPPARRQADERRRSAVGGRGALLDLTDMHRHVENVRLTREQAKKEKKRESGIFSSVRSRGKENSAGGTPTPTKPTRYASADKSRASNASADKSNASKVDTSMGSVRQRVLEWEREKQRLREMQLLEERDGLVVTDSEVPTETETEEESEAEVVHQEPWAGRRRAAAVPADDERKGCATPVESPVTPTESTASFVFEPITAATSTSAGVVTRNTSLSAGPSAFTGFKQNFRQSINKVGDIVRSSSTHHDEANKQARKSFDTMSFDMVDDAFSVAEPSPATSSQSEAEEDRLISWMKNVESIVEDARQNFASSSLANTTLPPLPLPVRPPSHSKASHAPREEDQLLDRSVNSRFSRSLPRRAIAANQIFAEDGSLFVNPSDISALTSPASPSFPSFPSREPDSRDVTADATTRAEWTVEGSFFQGDALPELKIDYAPSLDTPRRRRVTLSVGDAEDLLSGSPTKKRDPRHRSQGDLLQRKIAPVDALEKELSRLELPVATSPTVNRPTINKPTSNRLSAVFDRSLFIAPRSPGHSTDHADFDLSPPRTPGTPITNQSFQSDELNASPCIVEPYPQRIPKNNDSTVLDSPSQRRIESVYDRFLMATTSVRRVGKGYQSETIGGAPVSSQRQQPFYTTRRAMPPPVSSEDLLNQFQQQPKPKPKFVDEMWMMSRENKENAPGVPVNHKGEGRHTVAIVRRAFKAMVHPKTVGRRVVHA